jgi:hypothetical protein
VNTVLATVQQPQQQNYDTERQQKENNSPMPVQVAM